MRRRLRIATLLLLAVGLWYHNQRYFPTPLGKSNRKSGGGGGGGGGLPDNVKAIFGSWVQDESVVFQVSAAIAAGKIVRIRNGFDSDLAVALHTELRGSTYNYVGCNSVRPVPVPVPTPLRDTKGFPNQHDHVHGSVPPTAGCKHPHRAQRVPVDTTAFFQSDGGGGGGDFEGTLLCSEVEALNLGDFFFSGGYRRQVDPDGLPPLAASIARRLDAVEVNAWVRSVLQTRRNISSSTFGVRNFKPGDLSGMHTDNVKGRYGGLSMTSYFTEPGLRWDASAAGGCFVWCADPQTPVKVAPEYNTILLFKIGTSSKHFVEPVLRGAAPRFVLQGWWGSAEDTEDTEVREDTALPRAGTAFELDIGSPTRDMLTIG